MYGYLCVDVDGKEIPHLVVQVVSYSFPYKSIVVHACTDYSGGIAGKKRGKRRIVPSYEFLYLVKIK